ncbi:hypothetical protein ACFPRL_08215 [Pseudoclavibacter helvolus]
MGQGVGSQALTNGCHAQHGHARSQRRAGGLGYLAEGSRCSR